MLIVFGVALLGVLVEAFVPRTHRYVVQIVLALRRPPRRAASTVVLVAPATLDRRPTTSLDGTIEAMGAIAVDGPSLFIWGTPAGARR